VASGPTTRRSPGRRWAAGGAGTIYDLMRGLISQLPTGGKPAETCLAPDSGSTQFVETETPALGAGFYYLVRARTSAASGLRHDLGRSAAQHAVCP